MSLLVIGGLAAMGVGGYMLLRNKKRKKETMNTRTPIRPGPYTIPRANTSYTSASTSRREESSTSDFASGAIIGALAEAAVSSLTRSSESESRSWSSPSREETFSGGGGSSAGGGSSYDYSSDSSDSGSSSSD